MDNGFGGFMTEEQIKKSKFNIDKLSHERLAWLWRFNTRANHPYFTNKELFKYLEKKFNEFGGMTPQISKKIGWG